MHFLLHRRVELRAGIKGRKQSTAGGGRSQLEGSCEAVCRAANLRIFVSIAHGDYKRDEKHYYK